MENLIELKKIAKEIYQLYILLINFIEKNDKKNRFGGVAARAAERLQNRGNARGGRRERRPPNRRKIPRGARHTRKNFEKTLLICSRKQHLLSTRAESA